MAAARLGTSERAGRRARQNGWALLTKPSVTISIIIYASVRLG